MKTILIGVTCLYASLAQTQNQNLFQPPAEQLQPNQMPQQSSQIRYCTADYEEKSTDCEQKCPASSNWDITAAGCGRKSSYTRSEHMYFQELSKCNEFVDRQNQDRNFDYNFLDCEKRNNVFIPPCEYGFVSNNATWECTRDDTVTCDDFNMDANPYIPNFCLRKSKPKQTYQEQMAQYEDRINNYCRHKGYTPIGSKCKTLCLGNHWGRTQDTCFRQDFKKSFYSQFVSQAECEAALKIVNEVKAKDGTHVNHGTHCQQHQQKWTIGCPFGWKKKDGDEWTCEVDASVTCEQLDLATSNGTVCKRVDDRIK